MREAPATTGSPSHLVTRLCRFAAVTRHENALTPFATRNLEQFCDLVSDLVAAVYRIPYTHGYTRTRGARTRSHRTHARAATGQTAIGQAPDSRAPQRRASTSHASAASVKRHTAQTQAQLCTPLSPCHPARTKRPERRPHVSLGIVAPCVCHPSKGYTRRASTSMHAQTQTIPASIHRNSAARTAARKICTMAASAAARRKAHEQKKPQRAGPPPGSSV